MEIYLNSSTRLKHKAFSEYILPKGYYYYVGSAQKNLTSRILRHLKKEKNIYWHIDYLTAHKNAAVKKIYIFLKANKHRECETVHFLISNKIGVNSIPDFGNSDCNNCQTHLLYSAEGIPQSQLFALYQSIVLWMPSSS